MFTADVLDPTTDIMCPVKLDSRDPIRDINQQLGCIFTDRVPDGEQHRI